MKKLTIITAIGTILYGTMRSLAELVIKKMEKKDDERRTDSSI